VGLTQTIWGYFGQGVSVKPYLPRLCLAEKEKETAAWDFLGHGKCGVEMVSIDRSTLLGLFAPGKIK
jgi:hypothetical protein